MDNLLENFQNVNKFAKQFAALLKLITKLLYLGIYILPYIKKLLLYIPLSIDFILLLIF